MSHEFTVRTPHGAITTLSVVASTRALAAAWIDRSEFTVVARIPRRGINAVEAALDALPSPNADGTEPR